ncbi:uncharacterized protein EDB93DRAFT_1179924 [Suillus bovinus]|uniref:uncharacterized protein n=1 Tax=Suillus bovinus TaxID=48563 RepID=UPI001B886B6C|nr:uncharacterized protein EDB93DRAFT_1179924 [Suillus bovinus]KAG2130625.1 hypothetical protein EDB93DRAFT_1179924 [Suillus bovinus]
MGCMRAFELETNGLFNVAIAMFTRTDRYKNLFQSRLFDHSYSSMRVRGSALLRETWYIINHYRCSGQNHQVRHVIPPRSAKKFPRQTCREKFQAEAPCLEVLRSIYTSLFRRVGAHDLDVKCLAVLVRQKGRLRKITLLDILLRFLGLVNSQTPYDIVGVDSLHNMGSRLPYVNETGFATLACPNWPFEMMTSGGFNDAEILTMARTPSRMSPDCETSRSSPVALELDVRMPRYA